MRIKLIKDSTINKAINGEGEKLTTDSVSSIGWGGPTTSHHTQKNIQNSSRIFFTKMQSTKVNLNTQVVIASA